MIFIIFILNSSLLYINDYTNIYLFSINANILYYLINKIKMLLLTIFLL